MNRTWHPQLPGSFGSIQPSNVQDITCSITITQTTDPVQKPLGCP